jgi:hypothetical protein
VAHQHFGDFSIQPWFAFADSFERAGQETDARRLRYHGTDELMKRRRSKWAEPWRLVTKATIGHGYYPGRALIGILILWVAATILVMPHGAAFSPTDFSAAVAGETTESSLNAGYPGFWAPLYAVDIVLAPIGTGQSEAWRVSADPFLSSLIVIMKLSAYALLGLFVTGITGLIGKR